MDRSYGSNVQPFIEEISEPVSMSWFICGVLYLVYFVLKGLDIIGLNPSV